MCFCFGLCVERMKLRLEVALACIIILLWFQYISCDELPDGSGTNKWTCSCASAQQGNQSYASASNCSTSCDCSPEEAGGDRWTCLCAVERFPKTVGLHGSSCFTACNCTSGFPVQPKHSSKHIFSKVAVYILLMCVLLTTVAFFASLACYIHRKGKCPLQLPLFSSDKGTSCNTTTNLISHRSNSMPEFKANVNSLLSPFTGCIWEASFTFRNKRGTVPGTIIEFTYSELEQATNKFSGVNLIGFGGSSHVYCGQLKDGTTVAVKRLKTDGGPDADSVFLTEITDLGMAKRLRNDDLPSCSNSPARMQGTFGYFAPEYAIIGKACLKSDVFSFGVVLLELISGRQPIHKVSNKGDESLVIWATPRLQDSTRVISELPDPLLKGKFPEDEMHIMAYLAKECLLLDPDSRPTMSEVVQILSTIAPETSRRRNFPPNLYQCLSSPSTKSAVDMEMPEEHDNGPIDAESLQRITSARWSAWYSLQQNLDRTLCVENSRKEVENTLSIARSWHAPDDETVDLTEPRFESFCIASIQSP
ncbi:receptor-like serine/threonine-protein kinase NCRK isoform X6 [Telopea speciosissima]|uniref:receptor-like serine/threonine-protein kinase NCRK isoform X6 n=1 Tax=Telopea speciosissima TaxID=54955 RepID=UPI001CC4B23C|nr:receptor-like serine/threonine-protein kinase NCRK isoform X6 [Telopea speciosissima]